MALMYDDPNAPATAPGARNFSPFETALMGPGQAGPMQIDPAILAQLFGQGGVPNMPRPQPLPWQGPEVAQIGRSLPQIHSRRSPIQQLIDSIVNPPQQQGHFNLHQHNARGIAQAMEVAHRLQAQRQMSRLLKRFVGR